MRFTAAGDMLTQRRLVEYDGLDELSRYIGQGDARYFNLETTLNNEGECFGSAFNGGSYLRADPRTLDDCRRYGFNMLSFCNNHTMDYSYDGLVKTLEHIEASDFIQAGVGRNLSAAAAPAYLETPKGRIALIGFVSTCDPSMLAGEQSRRVKGRPGVNQLRFKQTIIVNREDMEAIQRIAANTHINAETEIVRAEGYRPDVPEGYFEFGNLMFRLGDEPMRETKCNPDDLKRMEKAVYEASMNADYILVAIHSHEISGASKESPSQFLQEFAHACIDAGADAVIGHGPHLLRPVEIYGGRPIFYSLGDFVMENESIPFGPEDFFVKYGLSSDATMHELFRTRSRDFTRGLQTKRVMFETVIPYWEMEGKTLTHLELMPVELGFDLQRSLKGRPHIAKDDAIVRRLAAMSEPFGTRMRFEGNRAIVEL